MNNLKKVIEAAKKAILFVYGPTFSPREILVTAFVVVVVLKVLGV